MSWSGLNTGLYEQIRHYAEITDQALVELKDDSDPPRHESTQRLGKLLSELDSIRRQDLSARLMWLILHETMKMKEQEIVGLGITLLNAERNDSAIKSLEKLAQALAKQQAVVKARMRSGVR
jgi:hypothetical protein